MKCPSCDGSLKTIVYEGVTIETCPGCLGEWLDATELGSIVKAREVKFDQDTCSAIARSTGITGVDLEEADRDLTCPKCGGNTDTMNYGADTGILIDRCKGCGGFWLDGDELEKIQKLVEGWEGLRDEDNEKYGPIIRKVQAEFDEDNDQVMEFSHLPLVGGFINTLIHGILNLSDD